MNLKSKYLGLKIHNPRYQPRSNRRRVTDGLSGLMKTSIDPIPVMYPHHHQLTKDRVPQSFHVGQTEFFRHPTVVGPKLVISITLRKGVVVPMELSLDQSIVLLSRKD